MSSQKRVQVPDSLRDLLLEFSIAYLLEKPSDGVDFAVEFFTKMQDNRKRTVVTIQEPLSPDESIMSQEDGKFLLDFFLLEF